MAIYLPFADLEKSADILDNRTLRVQLDNIYELIFPKKEVKLTLTAASWINYHGALSLYGMVSAYILMRRLNGWPPCDEIRILFDLLSEKSSQEPDELPWWFGLAPLHHYHQSLLIQKDPQFYLDRFDPRGENNYPTDYSLHPLSYDLGRLIFVRELL